MTKVNELIASAKTPGLGIQDSGKEENELSESVMHDDDLAILGEYGLNDEREKRDAKDVILEYDEYEK